MGDAQRKELNLKAARLIKPTGIPIEIQENEFDKLREKHGFVGFAHYYLQESYDESKLENKADISIYKQLLEIESQLGITPTEQLFKCVFHSVRIDLIKV